MTSSGGDLKLDPKILKELTEPFEPVDFLRVTPLAFRKTPLGMGFGKTRFASPDNTFKVLYIANDLATGIAETIIRDRFENRIRRRLSQAKIETWGAAQVSASSPLHLVDIRTSGLLKLGVSTDAKGAKSHRQGRKFSKAVYEQSSADGIIYLSRLTGEVCCAVYDRAVAKLDPGPVEDVLTLADLFPALEGLRIEMIRNK